jgi:diguanylate cyclase (GGDEF)-like protein
MPQLRRPPAPDGGSLRARLLALVLVPLVGVGVLAAVQVVDRIGSAQAATRAEDYIRSAAAVDAVRGAFEQEIIPALSMAAMGNQTLLPTVATPALIQAATAITDRLPSLRSATDAAVAALAAPSSVPGGSLDLGAELATVRAGIDNPEALTNALSGAISFLTTLAARENTQIIAATTEGIDSSVTQALRDVELTARATEVAAEEAAMFSATQFAEFADSAQYHVAWAQAWGSYAAASTAVAKQSSPSIAEQWNAVNATASVQAFNQFLASNLTTTATLPVMKIVQLLIEDGARNQAYMAVLATTLDGALVAGRAQRHRAMLDLAWIIAAALLLVVLSLGIAALVRRSITRPLDQLAEQATRISEGELTDVHVGGPREVRTVARALSSTVASLRDIEAQAAALAAGDLGSSVVRQTLPGPLGEVVHSSVDRIISAINEREIAQRELAHRAAHDALTELPNRAQALNLIDQALHRAQRSSTKTAVMFVDLDHFKAVNDNFGHAAGDEVLQNVARRMLRVVRDGDSVARLGGDEFVVLLENISDEADVVKLAARIVEQLSAEMLIDQRAVRIGASVGIAFCRDSYVDADRLLQEADAAAYRAKNAGRGRVEVFDDGLRTELKRRAELELAIAAGLATGEFVLYYQPVVDLKSGDTVGVEALARWIRPGLGLVPPDHFIPVAEQSTLINDIGRWVLHEATRQLRQWEQGDASTSHLTMAVNISGRHLASNQLMTDVIDALADSGVDPNRLVLELTETVLVDDPVATRNMQALRGLGVQIAIDDFGTGFTSIGQLPRLPVDTLKIDRSFIASADPAHQELVRLIVAAAHAFDLSVVAEGIEYQHQADKLRDANVECGQGFLFARPQPPATVLLTASSAESEQLPVR